MTMIQFRLLSFLIALARTRDTLPPGVHTPPDHPSATYLQPSPLPAFCQSNPNEPNRTPSKTPLALQNRRFTPFKPKTPDFQTNPFPQIPSPRAIDCR